MMIGRMASKKRSKKSKKKWKGEMTGSDSPIWQPLLDLVGTYLAGDFMWMFEVGLEDGRRLHAYKHRWTRRYIHLTVDGHALYYEEPNFYCETDPHEMLDRVLAPLERMFRPCPLP